MNSPHVTNSTSADFERLVIERSRSVPVVVDFWAEWCGPCRMLGPLIERLTAEADGRFVLVKVDVDRAPDLAQAYGISGIPAVKAFRDGRVVDEFTGLLPEASLRAFLEGLAPSQDEVEAERARGLEARDPAAAEASYRAILARDRSADGARVGLARLLVGRRADREARELLADFVAPPELSGEVDALRARLRLRELAGGLGSAADLRRRAESNPADAVARLDLGTALAAEGRHETALAVLLEAAELDKSLARDRVKEVMVAVFHVIGVRSPLADEYRSRLTRVLY